MVQEIVFENPECGLYALTYLRFGDEDAADWQKICLLLVWLLVQSSVQ